MRFQQTLKSLLILCFGLAVGAWLSGLFLFAAEVHLAKEPAIDAALPPADVIVVLTGGSERLTTGLSLLTAGKGRKLFISGVHAGLTLANVLAQENVSEHLRTCCIVLGHAADNTLGNAEETRAWMEQEHFKSLRLVTANYHMPRSLLAFRKVLPYAEIVPHPVTPDSVVMDYWWARPGTASLLMTEYNKYIFMLARTWVNK